MYAIESIGICKYFGNLKANDDITIQIESGTVHAICGENGAGKSTLVNVLYGLYRPTAGSVRIKGKDVILNSPKDAINLGVGMVHQHFMLINNLTVAENIVLGQETGTPLYFDRKQAIKNVEELCEQYNLMVDPTAKIEDITVGMQQRVEILKALYRGVDILILDEPTAVLAPSEITELFENIKMLVSTGKTVIIITHKLDEVLEISDKISVLRLGKLIGTVDTKSVTESELTKMMIGREVLLGGSERLDTKKETEVFLAKDVKLSRDGRKLLNGINITVKSGEIVGIAGVDGNGQSEFIEVISGSEKKYDGEVIINNKNINSMSIREIKENSMGFIPEDRQQEGLVLDFPVNYNLVLGKHYLPPFAKSHFLNFEEINKFSEKNVKDFDIRVPSIDAPASTLSGGNQQKVILARETVDDPKFVIAAQPTRGLDVGAIEYVHNFLVESRNNNQGILLISFELDELLSLCDRIYVMHKGEIAGHQNKEDFDLDTIGKMMLGLKGGLDG
ncbi:MAG: ABC transporter ATP-binding protein [Erysipelotrichaceae bacterium]